MNFVFMILIVSQLIALVAALLFCYGMIRLNRLADEINRIIEDVFERRMAIINSGGKYSEVCEIKYPDFNATYALLKWYKPWQKVEDLIVY